MDAMFEAELSELGFKNVQAAETMALVDPLGDHGNQAGENNSRNRDSQPTSVGRGAPYLAARIKRDRPDIAARVKAGEFKSMRAAAIEAGIIKPPTPLDKLKAAWAKATKTERQAFMKWIN